MFLRQATASQSREVGPFVSDTDFKTVQTGLTIANTDVKLSANGAAGASKNSGGGTHRNNGMYGLTFDATDSATVGELTGSVVVSGALPVAFKFFVLEEAAYDALFAASAPGYVTDQPVNATKIGGTTQTGRDLGLSVLLSSGTGTGQVKLASGYVAPNWGDVGNPTTSLALTGTTVATTQKVDIETIKTNPVVNAGTITFPTTATLASTTNITAGTITTATNVTTVNGLAANVITASSIAPDAIGASELAADAVTEIQLGLATSTALATLHMDVTTLLGRITSGLFTGITSLAQWLGLLGGKQTGNSTARTEMRATGAGSGTFDETTDSQEALRDRGDAAWVTATGFATAVDYTTARAAKLDNLDATISSRATPAQVNTEADQALADYDGPTHAELTSELATADDSVLAAIAAMNNLSAAQVLTQIQTALTTAVADSIPADGSRPSIAQAAYMNTQFLNERLVAATTVTVYKPDGTTPLFTLTLNDATTPTAVTRAT